MGAEMDNYVNAVKERTNRSPEYILRVMALRDFVLQAGASYNTDITQSEFREAIARAGKSLEDDF